ncbi:MAG: hypothetical protein OXH99_22315 [Bryobacterales bacterium]|nr:hypothetical protein [Bryobacterales bacterium]
MTPVMNDDMKRFRHGRDNEDFGRRMPDTVFVLAKGRGAAQ